MEESSLPYINIQQADDSLVQSSITVKLLYPELILPIEDSSTFCEVVNSPFIFQGPENPDYDNQIADMRHWKTGPVRLRWVQEYLPGIDQTEGCFGYWTGTSDLRVVQITGDIPDHNHEKYQNGWYTAKMLKLSNDGTEWIEDTGVVDSILIVLNEFTAISGIEGSSVVDWKVMAYDTGCKYKFNNGQICRVFHEFNQYPQSQSLVVPAEIMQYTDIGNGSYSYHIKLLDGTNAEYSGISIIQYTQGLEHPPIPSGTIVISIFRYNSNGTSIVGIMIPNDPLAQIC